MGTDGTFLSRSAFHARASSSGRKLFVDLITCNTPSAFGGLRLFFHGHLATFPVVLAEVISLSKAQQMRRTCVLYFFAANCSAILKLESDGAIAWDFPLTLSICDKTARAKTQQLLQFSSKYQKPTLE